MLVFEICNDNKSLREVLSQFATEEIETFSLDGVEVLQFVIEITKLTAPLIAGVMLGRSNNEKITVKKNGIEITSRLSKSGIDKIKLAEKLLQLDKNDEF